jgi:protein required for attachment to host cells
MSIWILIANSSKAKIYEIPSIAALQNDDIIQELQCFVHKESRAKDDALVADNLGSFRHAAGGTGNFHEHSDPHEQEAILFARDLCNTLKQSHNNNEFTDLIIAAGPNFHGLLNQHMDTQVKSAITHSIQKDYTNDSGRVLEAHLRANLFPD